MQHLATIFPRSGYSHKLKYQLVVLEQFQLFRQYCVAIENLYPNGNAPITNIPSSMDSLIIDILLIEIAIKNFTY